MTNRTVRRATGVGTIPSPIINSGKVPLRVLLAEDDQQTAADLMRRLNRGQPAPFEIFCAATLQESLAAVRGTVFDLIVLNVNLPDSKGLATCRRLQDAVQEVPVVILTDEDTGELVSRALRQGVLGVLLRHRPDEQTLRHALMFAFERRRRIHAERQLNVGRLVQRSLLPDRSPRIEGYDIAALTISALETTGDYVDYLGFHAHDGAKAQDVLGIAIGDVGGHGLGAAIMMAEIRGCLHTLTLSEDQPDRILQRLLRIVGYHQNNYFLTIILAALNYQRHSVTYSSAGHPAWLFSATGEARCLPALACPLSVPFDESAIPLTAETVVLNRGEAMLLPTDGVYEAVADTGDAVFGIGRMIEAVQESWKESAGRIVSHLLANAAAYSGKPQPDDDMTAIFVRRDG